MPSFTAPRPSALSLSALSPNDDSTPTASPGFAPADGTPTTAPFPTSGCSGFIRLPGDAYTIAPCPHAPEPAPVSSTSPTSRSTGSAPKLSRHSCHRAKFCRTHWCTACKRAGEDQRVGFPSEAAVAASTNVAGPRDTGRFGRGQACAGCQIPGADSLTACAKY